MSRNLKRIAIIFFFLLTIAGIVTGIMWLKSTKPTCFDGIKNGEEEGIDCGSVCKKSCPTPTEKPLPLEVNVKDFQVVQGESTCSLVASVKNPNSTLGGQHVPYRFVWGSIEKKGEFYIFPGENERYISEMNVPCQNGVQPTLQIGDPPKWEVFKGFEKPSLSIIDSKLEYLNSPSEFAEIKGTIKNNSPFDLKEIEIFVVVKNSLDQVVAVNRTTINSILVSEKRDFRMFWVDPFPQEGGSYKFFTSSNLFNNANFVRAYSGQDYNIDKGEGNNWGDLQNPATTNQNNNNNDQKWDF